MKLPIYQVDAFTDGPFTGNPAAVVPLEKWLPDDVMQKIAEENNLSETAFFVKEGEGYHIRWFTPGVEVALCGHATLASAHVMWSVLGHASDTIPLTCRIGKLSVRKDEDLYTLNFPTDTLQNRSELITAISDALGATVKEVHEGRDDLLAVVESEEVVANLKPDFRKVSQFDVRGLLVTANGSDEYDFVSRGFFPLTGVNEDPATGSAHTTLTPYWVEKLEKTSFKACQLSKRKGYFNCTLKGDRTLISGKAHMYLVGEISI